MIEIIIAAAVFGFSLGFSQEMAKDLRRMLRRHRRPSRMGPPQCPPPLNLRRDICSISFPDPEPDRQPTNPFTGEPVKPQFTSPREIPGDTQ